MITGLDHVALVVRDLDAAVAGYQRLLGVEPNWLGGDGGARHAWLQFPNMALDIIAPDGEGAFGDRVRARLAARGEGLWALAFTVKDIEATQTLLNRRAIRATPPALIRSTHDDGRQRYWLGSTLDPDDTAGLQILLIAPPRDGVAWPVSPASGKVPAVALDHLALETPNPGRTLAIYGAKLGLDLRLDRRNEAVGARQLFFRAGDTVVEFSTSLKAPIGDGADSAGGLAWRVDDAYAARKRMASAGFDVSEVRTGRKAGTRVFTVRNAPAGVPTLMISAELLKEPA